MRRIDQITLKQLRALETIVGEGTISAAAERLNLTAPAVHSQLKTLEDVMGSALISRGGKGASQPTRQGEVMIAAYAEVRASLERAIYQVAALDRGQAGSVVLGVVSTAKYFAPRIVALLKAPYPEIEVVLKVGNRGETIAALERRQLDLCIMGRPPREPQVNAVSLSDHPHVIIAAADHPLSQASSVSREDLLGERFVMREPGSGTPILATRFLDEIGNGREIEMVEMTSNETIKQSVINGLGIALISAHTVAEELRSGRLVTLPVPGTPIVRTWFLLTRADQRPTPAAESVQAWIIDNRADFFPDVPS